MATIRNSFYRFFHQSSFLNVSNLHIKFSPLHRQCNSVRGVRGGRAFSSSQKETLPTSLDVLKYSESSNSRLVSNIVFQDDNIIAINKLQGLSVYGQNSSEDTDERPLVQLLPNLSQHQCSEELEIGLSLKSYYSGLVLLTKNPRSAEKLRKVLSGAASKGNLFMTYLAIVVGKPQCEMQVKKNMYLERKYLHDREMTVVCDKSVRSSRKEGKMIQTAISLNIIYCNDRTFSSLVEIKINKDKWDAIPALLSHFLSPVLGDNIYFSRTNYLMGVPIPAVPDMAFPGQMRLPTSTENALWDHFNLEDNSLPLFLHRHSVTLPDFPFRSSKSYEITAPPPEDFMAALDCLGLKLDDAG